MIKLRDLLPQNLIRSLGRDISEEALESHLVNTSRGGPNMPKYQLCSNGCCSLPSRRVRKTLGGATYHCRRHGDFFVRAK